MLMIVAWVNSSSPSWPISAPIPDCFTPANGVSGLTSRCLFTQTVPELIQPATPNARSRSDDQTQPANPVADGFMNRIVDIEPLEADPPLAGVEHGSGIDLRRHLLRIDVLEHNRRVVAAEFQRQALQGFGDARHHLLAGRGGAGESDL